MLAVGSVVFSCQDLNLSASTLHRPAGPALGAAACCGRHVCRGKCIGGLVAQLCVSAVRDKECEIKLRALDGREESCNIHEITSDLRRSTTFSDLPHRTMGVPMDPRSTMSSLLSVFRSRTFLDYRHQNDGS